MARRLSNAPVAVLSEESQRTAGDDARAMNLDAGRAVAEAVRTTLGPRGMDKMLVSDSGDVVVTNDGVTVLQEMDISHPAAEAIADVADVQESDAGDGTTAATILAGELLAAAEDRFDSGDHPATVVAGYRRAAKVAAERLDELAVDVAPDDEGTLRRIAETAMTGKGVETARERLAEVVVDAVRAAVADGAVDRDAVTIRSFHGGSLDDSRHVPGVLLDKDPVRADMGPDFEAANVLVYEGDVEASELDGDATVTDFEQYDGFVAREERELAAAVERIAEAGTDVAIVDGGIDEFAQQRLSERGIAAFRRVSDEDRARLADATGARRVADLDALRDDDLGSARVAKERIREYTYKRDAPSEETTVFTDLPGEAGSTILLRAGTEHALAEAERAVEDGVDVVAAAIEDGRILPGGGAPEIALSLALRDAAEGVGGREQLAVEAFADAVEAIPRTLAENAGLDPVDAIAELKAAHADGDHAAGLGADSGEVIDALDVGIVAPHRVAATGVEAATDAATTLLRIDDVIAAGDLDVSGDEEDAGG